MDNWEKLLIDEREELDFFLREEFGTMAKIVEITGYSTVRDSFSAQDEDGNTVYIDFSDLENWYKKAVARREAEEKKLEQKLGRQS